VIELPLRIRCSPSPRREPVAWFLPGDGPLAWLGEIATWTVKQSSLQLLVVPRSRRDPNPCGMLVLGAGKDRPSLRCLPYGSAGGRLFLPVEAILDPDVTDYDLSRLLLADTQYVFHPAAGLCAFSGGEVLELADLLQAPPPNEGTWDRAQPGVAFAQRLTSLVPEDTPTIEQIMEQGRGDIGTQSKQIRELPRSPDEPNTDPFSRMGRRARQMFAGLVDWLTRQAQGTAGSPTWVNRLQNWAQRQLDKVHDAWNRERDREILRLMDMLEHDPDRGLKYALPIGGESHRGLAPPGNRLGEREVNFNLRDDSGPADFWAVPDDYHRKLVARYRELANRELQLGRHRRAAYIFATLLGDLEAAATALTAGHHWREAAILYRDKLKRPMEAAKCLERGGLWIEAIALYEELNEFEKAGDLHRQLEQEEEARAMYGKAVAHHSRAGDLMGAARLLYEKLHEPDEALAALEQGWPNSKQAQACLGETFRLRGVLGRHAESHARIERFQRDGLRPVDVALLVDVLAELAARYPDRDVRELAADRARVHTAGRLTTADQDERRRLLSAVERLAPEDRLLPRDCQRYLDQRKVPPTPISGPIPHSKAPECKCTYTLPEVFIKAAVRCGDIVYLAGIREHGQLVIVRCKAFQTPETASPRSAGQNIMVEPEEALLFTTAPEGDDLLVCQVVARPVIKQQQLFTRTTIFSEPMCLGMPAGMSLLSLGAVRIRRDLTWTINLDGPLLHSVAIGVEGQIVATHHLEADLDSLRLPVPMARARDNVWVGLGYEVHILNHGGGGGTIPVDQAVTALIADSLRAGDLILTFPHGAALSRGGSLDLQPFAKHLANPAACFIGNRRIAIGSEMGLEIYAYEDNGLVRIAELTDPRSQPVALLPTAKSGRFTVVSANGVIEWFEA
jgi:tetratricopeptide (TPR) repeat protein